MTTSCSHDIGNFQGFLCDCLGHHVIFLSVCVCGGAGEWEVKGEGEGEGGRERTLAL